MKQATLFDTMRTTLDAAIEISINSLKVYGGAHRHWAVAYSGGKDSTACTTFILWAIKQKLISPPDSLTILYADTRLELPPLQQSAIKLLEVLSKDGHDGWVVLPELDHRFMVYVLGYGVPPSSNTFRWCTPGLKVKPMEDALANLRQTAGEKLLMLTGVRLGESAQRDARIALSCSKNSGECGQGWFQKSTPGNVADTLAPLLHWRLCHVYDWLYFDQYGHGYDTSGIAAVYGDDEIRTGCMGCPLAARDNALERVIKNPAWAHLSPLLELKALWRELKLPQWRKRKAKAEMRQDGLFSCNIQRMGPLTMEARLYGLGRVLDIQARSGVELINASEEARIREMWASDMWPRRWSKQDVNADKLIPMLAIVKGGIVEQPLLEFVNADFNT